MAIPRKSYFYSCILNCVMAFHQAKKYSTYTLYYTLYILQTSSEFPQSRPINSFFVRKKWFFIAFLIFRHRMIKIWRKWIPFFGRMQHSAACTAPLVHPPFSQFPFISPIWSLFFLLFTWKNSFSNFFWTHKIYMPKWGVSGECQNQLKIIRRWWVAEGHGHFATIGLLESSRGTTHHPQAKSKCNAILT